MGTCNTLNTCEWAMANIAQTTTKTIKCKQETHRTHPHASNRTFTRQTALNKRLLTRYVLCCRVCLKGLGLSRGVTVFWKGLKIVVGLARGVPDFCSSARNVKYPSNPNLRWFRSNQDYSDINNIRMDLLIYSFDRRNQNIDEEMDTVNLY